MSSSNWVRWGGLAGLAAGMMYTLTAILSLFAPQETVFESVTDYLIEVIFVVGLAGTLVVVASLHGLQKESYGRLGAAGSLTTFAGYALLFVAASATALAGREVLDTVFPMGVLAILLGSILLGIMTLRARVLPWWCAPHRRFPSHGSVGHGLQRSRGNHAGDCLGADKLRALAETRRAGPPACSGELMDHRRSWCQVIAPSSKMQV